MSQFHSYPRLQTSTAATPRLRAFLRFRKFFMSYRFAVVTLALCWSETALGQGQPPQGPPQGEEPQAGPPQGPSQATLELMDLIKREPTVRDVQKATLEHFRVDPERVRSLAGKARTRWVIPDLTGSFRNEDGTRDSRMTDFLAAPDLAVREQTRDTSGAREWQLSASWSLRGLLFDNAELDVYSLVGVQESLLREVTTLYFTRRRMQVGLAMNPPVDDLEAITEALRVEELSSTLDALTGGLFTRRLSAAGTEGERR